MASKSKIPKMSESNDSDEKENREVKEAADWWMDAEVPSGNGGATTTLRSLKNLLDKQMADLQKSKQELQEAIDSELSEIRDGLQQEIHVLNSRILTLEDTLFQQAREKYLLENELRNERQKIEVLRKELAQLPKCSVIDTPKSPSDVNK